MKKCRICGREGFVTLRAYRISLCKDCYISFFERQVERSIKKYNIIKEGEKILVALSGGKDSVVLASVLKSLSNTFKFNLQAVFIDLGVKDFSKRSEEICKDVCKKLGIDLHILKLADYGFTIQDVHIKKVCSVCGNARRYILNKFARENGFDVVATGHNADDIVVNFLKNWASGNKAWIEKQLPRTEGMDKIVTRIRPLFLRTGEENRLYTKIKGLPFISEKCPYSKRYKWETIIDEIEDKMPGFTQNVVRNLFTEKHEDKIEYRYCSICGEMTTSDVCQFCRNVARYGKFNHKKL